MAHAVRSGRSASRRTQRLGCASGWTARLLLFASACWASVASADPPYGQDFDAPDWPLEAPASIDPGHHLGYFHWPRDSSEGVLVPDTDWYQFTVAQGQSIAVECAYDIRPCNGTLFDPAGMPQTPEPAGGPIEWTVKWTVQDASAGTWRLELSAPKDWGYENPYVLSLSRWPEPGGGDGGSGGAGAFGFGVMLLLGAVTALRRRREAM